MVHTMQKWRIWKMKIYRCVLGCLIAFFLVIGVIFLAAQYNERRSIDGGTLIWREENVTTHHIC